MNEDVRLQRTPEGDEYRRLLKQAEEMRAKLPDAEILGMATNGFVLARDELVDVINRLGNRKRDIEELLSVAKSLEELARKVRRLAQRLVPEFAGPEAQP